MRFLTLYLLLATIVAPLCQGAPTASTAELSALEPLPEPVAETYVLGDIEKQGGLEPKTNHYLLFVSTDVYIALKKAELV